MMTRITLASAVLAMLAALPASAQMTAYGTAARVNGVEISNEKLEKNFEEYQRENNVNVGAIRHPFRVTEMKREVLDKLIDQELVWQFVQDQDLYASPEIVERSLDKIRGQFPSEDEFVTRISIEGFTPESYREHVRRMVSGQLYLETVAETAAVSADEIHDFYANNPDKFEMPEMAHARHILLKVHPNANAETRARVQERMDAIVAELEGGADFAVLAATYSEDSSKDNGGDLGYFSRGEMVPQFDQVAFTTAVGEVSGIVETIYGLHLIKVEDRQPSQIVPESMAQQQIYDHLLEVKRRQAMREEIATLRAAADIEVLLPF
jgi:parvulin-like peptidyl-prolyl isomerase